MDLEESMRRVTAAFQEAENTDLDTVSREYFSELNNHVDVFRDLWEQCLQPMFMEWRRGLRGLWHSGRRRKRLIVYRRGRIESFPFKIAEISGILKRLTFSEFILFFSRITP